VEVVPAAVLAVPLLPAASDPAVYDGFETPQLSSFWTRRKFAPGAPGIQSRVALAGQGAVRLTLREGDWVEKGARPGGPPVGRAELEEAPGLWSREDKLYAWPFSMFVPSDFPIVPTRLVLAQWKQKCPVASCELDNPVAALRYSGANFPSPRGR
jgi:hypothetical protein